MVQNLKDEYAKEIKRNIFLLEELISYINDSKKISGSLGSN